MSPRRSAQPESPAARLLLEALLHHAPADLGVLIAVHVTEGPARRARSPAATSGRRPARRGT